MGWKIDPRVAWQTVDGEAVVLDLATGRAIGLNATGTLVWTFLPSESEESIAGRVAETFGVDAETALADVAEFVAMLRDRRLIAEELAVSAP
jgi:hypothetical protein